MHLIYITVPDIERAQLIAQTLVKEHYAACVNILPKVQSIYEWQGKLLEESEIVLIAKTADERVELVLKRVKEIHPYEAPAILAIKVDQADKDFIKWLETYTIKPTEK